MATPIRTLAKPAELATISAMAHAALELELRTITRAELRAMHGNIDTEMVEGAAAAFIMELFASLPAPRARRPAAACRELAREEA